MAEHAGYKSGHPWYYKLGGRILTPDEIAAEVESSKTIEGNTTLVEKLDRLIEPRRSNDIKAAIQSSLQMQQANIERYNEVTSNLTYERERPGPYTWDNSLRFDSPSTGTFLKHNHIAYEHATLCKLRALGSIQMELFAD